MVHFTEFGIESDFDSTIIAGIDTPPLTFDDPTFAEAIPDDMLTSFGWGSLTPPLDSDPTDLSELNHFTKLMHSSDFIPGLMWDRDCSYSVFTPPTTPPSTPPSSPSPKKCPGSHPSRRIPKANLSQTGKASTGSKNRKSTSTAVRNTKDANSTFITTSAGSCQSSTSKRHNTAESTAVTKRQKTTPAPGPTKPLAYTSVSHLNVSNANAIVRKTDSSYSPTSAPTYGNIASKYSTGGGTTVNNTHKAHASTPVSTLSSVSSSSSSSSSSVSTPLVQLTTTTSSGILEDNPENKRKTHNVLERKRRNDLKNSYQTLREQLPDLADNRRAPTGQILALAVNYIAQLQRESSIINNQVAALRAENLRKRNARLAISCSR